MIGDPGAEPDLSILIPENKIPWGGHSGRHAAREVMALIEQHKTTLVFCNTRSLAELIFQDLWAVNDQALPIGIHHGSLAVEARRKVEAAMAAGGCAGWSRPPASTSASTGATSTWSSRWARPRAARACCSGSAAPTTGSTSRAKGIIVPGNRFEYLEARAALDAIDDGELDPETFRPGALDVLAQHILAMAVAAPFQQDELLAEVRSAAPYAGLKPETFEEILNFIATGGYALKAYDRFRRLVPEPGGMWRIAKPAGRAAAPPQRRGDRRAAAAHRPLPQRAQARHDRGRLCLDPHPRRPFLFLRPQPRGRAVQGHRHYRPRLIQAGAHRHLRRAADVDVDPPRQPRAPHARRPQRLAPLSRRRPRMARSAVGALGAARTAPAAGRDLPARRNSISWSPTASKAGTRTSRSAC